MWVLNSNEYGWWIWNEVVDKGAAQLMCDVLNARDYPNEFTTGVTNDTT